MPLHFLCAEELWCWWLFRFFLRLWLPDFSFFWLLMRFFFFAIFFFSIIISIISLLLRWIFRHAAFISFFLLFFFFSFHAFFHFSSFRFSAALRRLFSLIIADAVDFLSATFRRCFWLIFSWAISMMPYFRFAGLIDAAFIFRLFLIRHFSICHFIFFHRFLMISIWFSLDVLLPEHYRCSAIFAFAASLHIDCWCKYDYFHFSPIASRWCQHFDYDFLFDYFFDLRGMRASIAAGFSSASFFRFSFRLFEGFAGGRFSAITRGFDVCISITPFAVLSSITFPLSFSFDWLSLLILNYAFFFSDFRSRDYRFLHCHFDARNTLLVFQPFDFSAFLGFSIDFFRRFRHFFVPFRHWFFDLLLSLSLRFDFIFMLFDFFLDDFFPSFDSAAFNISLHALIFSSLFFDVASFISMLFLLIRYVDVMGPWCCFRATFLRCWFSFLDAD